MASLHIVKDNRVMGKSLWTNHHPYTIGDWCVYKKCDYARLDV